MALHFVDPNSGAWESIENPSPDQILAALATVRPACERCDAEVRFEPPTDGGPPIVEVLHEDGCDAA